MGQCWLFQKCGFHEDAQEAIIDIHEYDVPYYLWCTIDNDFHMGLWYAVSFTAGQPAFRNMPERVKHAHPIVMAYDIETTKAPLKFPDQATDQVMMILYMVDGQGYLITNREIVSEDIEDFEYTPKDGYEGPFIIFNEPNEVHKFFLFLITVLIPCIGCNHHAFLLPYPRCPFNSNFFDFPFLDARAKVNRIDMFLETGFAKDSEDEYKSRTCAYGLLPLGKARFLSTPGESGLESGHDRQVWLQSYRTRPRAYDSVSVVLRVFFRELTWSYQLRDGATSDTGPILGLRCSCNLLSVHEICPPFHLLSLQHNPAEFR